MRGLVTRSTGSSYTVCTEDGTRVECRIKGNFRIKGIKSTNPVAVGDYVTLQESEKSGDPAYITGIEDRRNYIVRRSSNLSKQSHILACNLDQCLLLVTLAHPETSPVFVDRFLATAEAYRIPVTIVINKTDLLDEEGHSKADDACVLYRSLGYPCIQCDALHGSIDEVRSAVSGKVTLLAGNSGTGKSTMINRLIPGMEQRTAVISAKHDTGMHTTTFSEMFQLEEGGWIIDTPGVKGFGMYDMKPEEIGHYFREIFKVSAECRYGNCTHTTEPGCAVKNAVSTGKISISRYTSYLSMLDDENESKYRKDPSQE